MTDEKIKIVVDEDLEDLIPSYLDKRIAEIDIINACLQKQDYTTIRQIGHDWHGTGESFGFSYITESGIKMNQAAKDKNNEEIHKILIDFEKYLNILDITFESFDE